ncbi:MAG: hypothetical protein HY754_00255, partial [Nitrospirae bacterium]|nr:hypothetical protein [Nitrospirota bacterium]
MHKRFLISILVAILLTITLSSAYAAPDKDSNVDIFVWPRYWQWEEAKEKNNGEMAWKNDAYAGRLLGEYWKPFYKNGCLVSSLSMLFNYYGLSFIPDYYHNTELCKDTEFSNYCSERGILYSETDPGNLNRWLTDNEVYQNKWLIFDYLLAEEVMRRFWRYKDEWGGKWAIRPNFKCYPIGKWFDEGCYKVDWSDPMAQQLLDEDLKNKRPDIMKIKWTDKDGDDHDNHFVLIGGYDWDKAASETSSEDYSPEDYYRAYDPNVAYSLNKSQYGRYMS